MASLIVVSVATAACSRERRAVGVGQVITDPVGPDDPRTPDFRDNVFQVSQGGRYFAWYSCGQCHGQDARGAADLAGDNPQNRHTIDQIIAAIARHDELGQRVPVEQRWQLAAYVAQLSKLDPAQRRRQDLDQKGEPTASQWNGAIR